MSYNPAFVGDESPLAGANAHLSHDQSNGGIKLTSFKPLATLNEVKFNGRNENGKQTNGRHFNRKCQTSGGGGGEGSGQAGAENFHVSNSTSLALFNNPALGPLNASATTTTTTIATANNLQICTNQSNSSFSSDVSSLASSQASNLCAAVECRDMRYTIGRGKGQKTILHDINVTVPEGSIYGLLGPSGCGKTTMLRCVVGRIKPKSGYVRVFGYAPNQSGSQIPGPAIGYMPQVSVLEKFMAAN